MIKTGSYLQMRLKRIRGFLLRTPFRCVLYVLFHAPMLCPDSGQMIKVPDARTSGGTEVSLTRKIGNISM